MKLIVGLGNPGLQYQQTRHNAGFLVLDELIKHYRADFSGEKFQAQIFTANIAGEKVIMAKPLTFMNLSGDSVIKIISFYKLSLNDVVILHDEKDFPITKQQFKNFGSPAGHNGLKSLISHFHTTNFQRLRIGIGNPEPGWKIVDWVLSKISDTELKTIITNFVNKINWLKDWVEGMEFINLMNKYN
ncbi:peptidyl-tRNA hydrolase [Spiroplasma sabaudiense Ar-1343]|uniref:Peptidyl-tRNA hydrolase n=1 Tax=Spiroplasma sabaudiense Ar-1343 TaxID=1276257 RepID=W6AB26_9MOLU|nr:aminoacyl-tRNA hydrolase [Spiroplasma sabaudiense]AHI54237.1 peptidyl-tRNA hydrolase [Spiroplasma sabaudiense Ar-1343]